jgi:choline dehydrogenase
VDPHPGRLSLLHGQSPHRLDDATEAEAGLNGRSLAYPRGKVLGGCSSINGMIYMRGQAADYDGWRQLGNPGWGWDDVLPLFRRSEDNFTRR